MRFTIAVALAVLPALTFAQSSSSALPTGASSIPACALSCTSQVVGSSSENGGCSTITDVTCICTSATFQRNVYQCYVNQCTTQELQEAEAYGSKLCASIGHPIDTSVTPSGITGQASGSGSASSTGGDSTSAAAETSSTSSAATTTSSPASSDAQSNAFSFAAIGAAMIGGLFAM